jgi:hypothetical protein
VQGCSRRIRVTGLGGLEQFLTRMQPVGAIVDV